MIYDVVGLPAEWQADALQRFEMVSRNHGTRPLSVAHKGTRMSERLGIARGACEGM